MCPSVEKINEKVSSKSKNLIKITVDKYTEKEIKAIAESCYKIRSLNNKKNETRKEFVSNFAKHYDTYKMVIKNFEDLALQTTANGDSKKDSLTYYVQIIRKREEDLAIKDYLLNEVKYGFMKSIVKWSDNPGAVKKTLKTTTENEVPKTKKITKKSSTSS